MRCRSSAIAALIAATDFSRPTPSGTTSFGKTTASRSGTTGRSLGYAPSGVVVFVSSVILFLCFYSRFGASRWVLLSCYLRRTAWPGLSFRPATLSALVLVLLLRVRVRCVDLDHPWLHVLGLRQHELQHTVVERGLDLGRI